jgi:large subunit ribosomal protein L2
LKKIKKININYNLRYIKLGFISSFNFIPFKNKLLSLVIFANGSFSYYLTTENHKLFSFLYFNFYKNLKKIKLKSTFFMLFQIKKLSFISSLEIIPGKGSQYSRSSGTKSRIIKFDKNNHSVLIKLPSGIKKIFSYYSFAMFGQIYLKENKNFQNGKAGYWRTFGFKSLVRGVAMNPVDHPHGGRTKSVKYPRTPWGKTTKFK